MRRIKIDQATELQGSVGTIQALNGILSLHPEHSKYEHQKKVAILAKHFKAFEGKDHLELEEADYEWIMSKLKTANYQGMFAGNLILSIENAEKLDA